MVIPVIKKQVVERLGVAHSLFMPERMQLPIVTSISCVLLPGRSTTRESAFAPQR